MSTFEQDYQPNCKENASKNVMKDELDRNPFIILGITTIQFIRFNGHNIYLFHEQHAFDDKLYDKFENMRGKKIFFVEDIIKGMLQTGFKTNYYHENFKYQYLPKEGEPYEKLKSDQKKKIAKKTLKMFKTERYESFYESAPPYMRRYITYENDRPKKYRNVYFQRTDIRYTQNFLFFKFMRLEDEFNNGNYKENFKVIKILFKEYLNSVEKIKTLVNSYLRSNYFMDGMRDIFGDKADLLFYEEGKDIITVVNEDGEEMYMHVICYEIKNSGYEELILEYLDSRINRFLENIGGMKEEILRSTGNVFFDNVVSKLIKEYEDYGDIGEIIEELEGNPENMTIDFLLDFFVNDYPENSSKEANIFTELFESVIGRYLSDILNDAHTLARELQTMDGTDMTITYGGSDHPNFTYDFFKTWKRKKIKSIEAPPIQLKCFGILQEHRNEFSSYMTLNIEEFNALFKSFMPKINKKRANKQDIIEARKMMEDTEEYDVFNKRPGLYVSNYSNSNGSSNSNIELKNSPKRGRNNNNMMINQNQLTRIPKKQMKLNPRKPKNQGSSSRSRVIPK